MLWWVPELLLYSEIDSFFGGIIPHQAQHNSPGSQYEVVDTIIHVDILKLTQIREFGSKIEDFSHLDCCAELGVGLFPRKKNRSPSIEGVLGPVTTFVLQEQANLAPKPTQGRPGGYWEALVQKSTFFV